MNTEDEGGKITKQTAHEGVPQIRIKYTKEHMSKKKIPIANNRTYLVYSLVSMKLELFLDLRF